VGFPTPELGLSLFRAPPSAAIVVRIDETKEDSVMAHAINATVAPPKRLLITRFAAGAIALLVLVGLGSAPALIAGFADRSDIHAFHGVEWGALAGVLFAGSMLIVALSPNHSRAALQATLAVGLAFVVVAVLARVVGPETLTPLVLAIIVTALSGISHLTGSWRPRSVSLAILAVAAAIPGVTNAVIQIGFQLNRTDPHSEAMHYAGSAVITLAIPAAAYIVATLSPGYRRVALLVGSAAIMLGMGSLLIQRTGAFAAIPAVLMILWGVAFIVLARSARISTAAATAA
jgi:hypothetical protein